MIYEYLVNYFFNNYNLDLNEETVSFIFNKCITKFNANSKKELENFILENIDSAAFPSIFYPFTSIPSFKNIEINNLNIALILPTTSQINYVIDIVNLFKLKSEKTKFFLIVEDLSTAFSFLLLLKNYNFKLFVMESNNSIENILNHDIIISPFPEVLKFCNLNIVFNLFESINDLNIFIRNFSFSLFLFESFSPLFIKFNNNKLIKLFPTKNKLIEFIKTKSYDFFVNTAKNSKSIIFNFIQNLLNNSFAFITEKLKENFRNPPLIFSKTLSYLNLFVKQNLLFNLNSNIKFITYNQNFSIPLTFNIKPKTEYNIEDFFKIDFPKNGLFFNIKNINFLNFSNKITPNNNKILILEFQNLKIPNFIKEFFSKNHKIINGNLKEFNSIKKLKSLFEKELFDLLITFDTPLSRKLQFYKLPFKTIILGIGNTNFFYFSSLKNFIPFSTTCLEFSDECQNYKCKLKNFNCLSNPNLKKNFIEKMGSAGLEPATPSV